MPDEFDVLTLPAEKTEGAELCKDHDQQVLGENGMTRGTGEKDTVWSQGGGRFKSKDMERTGFGGQLTTGEGFSDRTLGCWG